MRGKGNSDSCPVFQPVIPLVPMNQRDAAAALHGFSAYPVCVHPPLMLPAATETLCLPLRYLFTRIRMPPPRCGLRIQARPTSSMCPSCPCTATSESGRTIRCEQVWGAAHSRLVTPLACSNVFWSSGGTPLAQRPCCAKWDCSPRIPACILSPAVV